MSYLQFFGRISAFTLAGAIVTSALICCLGDAGNRFATLNPEANEYRRINAANSKSIVNADKGDEGSKRLLIVEKIRYN